MCRQLTGRACWQHGAVSRCQPGWAGGGCGAGSVLPAQWAMPGAGVPAAHAACTLLPAKPPASTPFSSCGEQPKPATGDIAASSDCTGGGRCGGRRRGGGRRAPAARGLPAHGARRLPHPAALLQQPEQPPAFLGSVAADQKLPPAQAPVLRVVIPIMAHARSGEWAHLQERLCLLSYQPITPALTEGPRGTGCPAPRIGRLYWQKQALAGAALEEPQVHRTVPQGAGGGSCPAGALARALLPTQGGMRIKAAALPLHRRVQPRAPIRAGATRLPQLPGPIVARHGTAQHSTAQHSSARTCEVREEPWGWCFTCWRSRRLQKARLLASAHPSDQKRSPAGAL